MPSSERSSRLPRSAREKLRYTRETAAGARCHGVLDLLMLTR